MNTIRIAVCASFIVSLLLVSACSTQNEHDDLNIYINDVKSRPKGQIEPLPPVRTYNAFVYQAAQLRSPFERPAEPTLVTGPVDPNVKPDPTRPKEFLESFNLDSLEMVGIMEQHGNLWALIKDGSGGIHTVTEGNYMGKNHGRIVSAKRTSDDLIEIVSDGLGGWVKRPKSIKLSEKE